MAPIIPAKFVTGTPGSLPNGAHEIGNEANGHKTYVCRTFHQKQAVLTGKLVFGHTCFYGFFGKEYGSQQYEVLVSSNDPRLVWVPWNGGVDWDVGRGGNRKAFVSGSYNNGPIAPCRASFKGGMVGGHFWGGTCFLPYYGVEYPVNNFELLGY